MTDFILKCEHAISDKFGYLSDEIIYFYRNNIISEYKKRKYLDKIDKRVRFTLNVRNSEYLDHIRMVHDGNFTNWKLAHITDNGQITYLCE